LGCTVAELGERMSAEEFVEWMVFNELEPMSPVRIENCIATLSAVVANMFRGKGKRPASPSDFMVDFFAATDKKYCPPKQEKMPQSKMKEIFESIKNMLRKKKKK